ncbi:MAG: hypothetical protein H7222_01875, partial [Methylotenera sp.]|nr:hypothetical protein [Oligoflexia bacterium]
DVAAARKAFARIEKEITRDQPEGIQWDNSFFQHGEVFQSAAYGLDFSMSIPRLMRIAVGTDFQFSRNSVEFLGNFILDGQRWLVRRQAIEISAMGRTYSRQGKNAIPIMRACRLMVDVPSTRQEEFRSCAESIRLSTPMPIHGNRSFWIADFMAHHTDQFYASVKMNSSRTYNTDFGSNAEGLRGDLLSDGATYFHRSGEEYRDIFGVWDFRHVPGVTAQQSAWPARDQYSPSHGPTAFVGGLSDGTTGFAAMDFKRDQLRARKSWFFLEDRVVALGAGIRCTGHCDPVHTTINQEWGKERFTLPEGRTLPPTAGAVAPTWIHHDGVGYLLQDSAMAAKTQVRLSSQRGDWKNINGQLQSTPAEGKVFSLFIDHGEHGQHGDSAASSQGDHYAYAVVPGVTSEQTAQLAAATDVEILSNSEALQAIQRKSSKRLQAVFFAPGQLTKSVWGSVKTNAACLVEIQPDHNRVQLLVSDPSRQAKSIRLELTGQYHCPTCRTPVTEAGHAFVTEVEVTLPTGKLAGTAAPLSLGPVSM